MHFPRYHSQYYFHDYDERSQIIQGVRSTRRLIYRRLFSHTGINIFFTDRLLNSAIVNIPFTLTGLSRSFIRILIFMNYSRGKKKQATIERTLFVPLFFSLLLNTITKI